MPNHFYNKNLKEYARKLRLNPTKAEKKIWYELLSKKRFGDYKFLRQRPINNFIVDFYCKELYLAIEIDGKTHEFEDVIEKDKIKNLSLAELKIKVLRFSDWEVMNDLGGVQEILWKEIQNRKQELEEKDNV